MSRLRAPLPALALAAASAVAAGVVAVVPASPAQAAAWPGHPDRSLVRHQVQAGDTATGLAVRYHAWTAELVALNHLGRSGELRIGQVIEIPVVLSAVHGAQAASPRPAATAPLINATTPSPGWRGTGLSRTQVRDLVARMARHYGVPVDLALAVAWQESGWQQYRVSGAGALGVMQVLPDTGRWMRWYAGRPLRLRDAHDNVQAGVLTLQVLRAWTRRDRVAVAAYYEGLGAVRQHGWYADTKAYVRSVYAIERRLQTTGSPV